MPKFLTAHKKTLLHNNIEDNEYFIYTSMYGNNNM